MQSGSCRQTARRSEVRTCGSEQERRQERRQRRQERRQRRQVPLSSSGRWNERAERLGWLLGCSQRLEPRWRRGRGPRQLAGADGRTLSAMRL